MLTTGSSNDLVVNQEDPSGTLIISATIGDGAGSVSLTKNGPGILVLTSGIAAYPNLYYGPQTYSGGTYINQGTLAVQGMSLGFTGNITFSGNATLQLSQGAYVSPHSSFIVNSGVTATLDQNNPIGDEAFGPTISRPISGAGSLAIISSVGNTTRTYELPLLAPAAVGGASIYTGATTIYDSFVLLDMETNANAQTGNNYLVPINVNAPVNLGGAMFIEDGISTPGGIILTKSLSTYLNLLADTSSQIAGGTGSGVYTLNSAFGNAIVRNGGATIEFGSGAGFSLYIGVPACAVANTNGIIGGWATTGAGGNRFNVVAGTDWASVGAGGLIVALAANAYTNDTWAAANNTTVTQTSDNPTSGSTTNTLRFVSLTTAAGNSLSQTVTLSGTNVIASGGILVTTNSSFSNSAVTVGTDHSNFTIAGGNLTSGNGTDLIVNQFNVLAGSSLTISSAIVNNGVTPIGLTLGGNTYTPGGTLIITNSGDSYTGPTAISAGTTLIAGAVNVIPAASAVVLTGTGTLNMNGFNQSIGSLASFSRGLTTISASAVGYGTTVVGNGTVTLTVGTDNTSSTFNGALLDTGPSESGMLSLVKVGTGVLTLGNFSDNVAGTPNLSDYSGGTTIKGGAIAIPFDSGLGAVPQSASPGNSGPQRHDRRSRRAGSDRHVRAQRQSRHRTGIEQQAASGAAGWT